MDIVFLRLFGLIVFEVLVFYMITRLFRDYWIRSFLYITQAGFVFYNGIGSIYSDVPDIYLLYFAVFQLFYVASFIFFHKLFGKLRKKLARRTRRKKFRILSNDLISGLIIILFLLITLSGLLYPTNHLMRLFNPPLPNFYDLLEAELSGGQKYSFYMQIMYYINFLILPFFYIALGKYVNSPWKLFLLLFIPIYIDYCAVSYTSRGTILLAMIIWYYIVYYYNPELRKKLIVGALAVMPFIIAMFYLYSLIRIGQDSSIAEDNIYVAMFHQETEFPVFFQQIYNSSNRCDVPGFFIWLITLPFPKALIGHFEVPVVNYDISELVLGVSRYSNEYFVKLTGCITESVYIFGRYLFWIEAVLVGFLSAFAVSIVRNLPNSMVFFLFIALKFGYTYSRAGINGVAPFVLNVMLLLYIYLIVAFIKPLEE